MYHVVLASLDAEMYWSFENNKLKKQKGGHGSSRLWELDGMVVMHKN